jgi:hypothetical protein
MAGPGGSQNNFRQLTVCSESTLPTTSCPIQYKSFQLPPYLDPGILHLLPKVLIVERMSLLFEDSRKCETGWLMSGVRRFSKAVHRPNMSLLRPFRSRCLRCLRYVRFGIKTTHLLPLWKSASSPVRHRFSNKTEYVFAWFQKAPGSKR